MKNRFMPSKVDSFKDRDWIDISGGQHHTVALDAAGKIYITALFLQRTFGTKNEPPP